MDSSQRDCSDVSGSQPAPFCLWSRVAMSPCSQPAPGRGGGVSLCCTQAPLPAAREALDLVTVSGWHIHLLWQRAAPEMTGAQPGSMDETACCPRRTHCESENRPWFKPLDVGIVCYSSTTCPI